MVMIIVLYLMCAHTLGHQQLQHSWYLGLLHAQHRGISTNNRCFHYYKQLICSISYASDDCLQVYVESPLLLEGVECLRAGKVFAVVHFLLKRNTKAPPTGSTQSTSTAIDTVD